ncbi:hypothetical protein CDL12_27769 [Handroanthus impetiginosus]|uniref:Uncharacterized protein n=1 Tax=Handroanthus impetiginosus TaxID=429701 RepID=A0A2G9G3L7_9LAMI|nr:hypothetical protein CDL12_27769 [Handroanthus impetiginosus]
MPNNQSKACMFVTIHICDDDSDVTTPLYVGFINYIRFIYVRAPHFAEVPYNAVVECLFGWNLAIKLSTLIVDICSINDTMTEQTFD